MPCWLGDFCKHAQKWWIDSRHSKGPKTLTTLGRSQSRLKLPPDWWDSNSWPFDLHSEALTTTLWRLSSHNAPPPPPAPSTHTHTHTHTQKGMLASWNSLLGQTVGLLGQQTTDIRKHTTSKMILRQGQSSSNHLLTSRQTASRRTSRSGIWSIHADKGEWHFVTYTVTYAQITNTGKSISPKGSNVLQR